jgi:hypothetical protein
MFFIFIFAKKKMKAIVSIPEKDYCFELRNVCYGEFVVVGTKPKEDNSTFVERYPVGEPIILLTSNMPDGLKNDVDDLVRRYCNH